MYHSATITKIEGCPVIMQRTVGSKTVGFWSEQQDENYFVIWQRNWTKMDKPLWTNTNQLADSFCSFLYQGEVHQKQVLSWRRDECPGYLSAIVTAPHYGSTAISLQNHETHHCRPAQTITVKLKIHYRRPTEFSTANCKFDRSHPELSNTVNVVNTPQAHCSNHSVSLRNSLVLPDRTQFCQFTEYMYQC